MSLSRFEATRLIVVLAVAFVLAAAYGTTASAQAANDLVVELNPTSVTGAVGDKFQIAVTVTNSGAATTSSLTVHIDVTDPLSASSVDPEDWTVTLSRPVSALEPGSSVIVRWDIQPISPGDYLLYAVAFGAERPAASVVAISNAVAVAVTERRSLNPRGVLPVVVAVPLLLGGAILVRRRQFSKADGPRAADV